MAKAVAKTKKTAAKSKSSAPVRAKAAPTASARKALKKGPAKPAPKPISKVAASKPAAEVAKSGKWVFTFGDGKAEGKAGLRDLLGGKGANLAEMANLGLPVPPGFTIPTSVCTYFYAHDKTYPKELKAQVEKALDHVGKLTGKAFGDSKNPLLVSVRSGGRASMPGMMDTVLNLGLNDKTVEALAEMSGDRRFAYDSYRRFITMYSDVVLGFEHHHFEDILDTFKDGQGYTLDTDLTGDDWVDLVGRYKDAVARETGHDFPQDPHAQLWGAIGAVFSSWMNARAVTHGREQAVRRIPDQRAGRRRGGGHPHAAGHHRICAQGIRLRQGIDGNRDAGRVQGADADLHHAGKALPRHAGHGVHGRAGQAVDAADPRRQAHRESGAAHRRRTRQ